MSTSRDQTVLDDPTTTPRRLARGIWLPGSAAREHDDLRRIAEASPPHCVFVGLTAARLLGLWVPPAGPTEPIEIASTATGRSSDMTRTRRPELAGSRRQLEVGDIVELDGVRVTGPARTWLDLAARLRLVETVALGDSVLRAGVAPAELADLLRRSRGRRGVRRARTALPLLDARSRSRPESHVRVELLVDGWPRFEVNRTIRDRDGGWLAEPDLSDEQYRVAIEYQGRDHADLGRMRRDLTRGTCVAGEFWQILPVGPAEAFTHPDRLRRAVRAMLLTAGWRPPTLPRQFRAPSGRADGEWSDAGAQSGRK